ncbi:MAG TPA: hypothetical protein VM639_24330 [Dongiaceae bacterium]|nr:hypothetical protein [Dongiaceae bacterium]
MTDRRLAFLDIAKSAGWATSNGRADVLFGVKEFPRGQLATTGQVFRLYRQWLSDFIAIHNPTDLAFEAPMFAGNAGEVAYLLIGMAAITEEFCNERGIPCYQQTPDEIRKHLLGFARGNDIKSHVGFKLRQLGYDVADHNAADALAGLIYMQDCFLPETAAILAGTAQ